MYYGLIETNRSGYGIYSVYVCSGKFEDHESYAMLAYNGNYWLTEYHESPSSAQDELDDLVEYIEGEL
jgi:hypothetical protein